MKKNVVILISIFSFLISNNFFGQETEKSNLKSDPNIPIFEIKNDKNQTVFAVYPGGVKIFIEEQLKAAGGGFTIGRLGTGKLTGDDFFVVNPGDVKVLIPETKEKAVGGGFTVGRLGTGKASGDLEFLRVTPDSTRIYVGDTIAGFGISNMGKTTAERLLNLNKQNYFIGHNTGTAITTGKFNTFFGYLSGVKATTGSSNVFIGQESGLNNTEGKRNIFIGYRAGMSNLGIGSNNTIGHDNIYIGTNAGRDIIEGEHNTLIGSYSGYDGTGTKNTFLGAFTGFAATGTANVFLGVDAGRNNNAGNNNVFLGAIAGNSNSGSNNTFLGYAAGYNSTSGTGNVFIGSYAGQNELGDNKLYIDNSSTASPLIYGDFQANTLALNGRVGINRAAYGNSAFVTEANTYGWSFYSAKGTSTTGYNQFEGNTGIAAQPSSTYVLYVGGNAYSTGAWSGSDVRWKKNIQHIKSPLMKLLKIRGVSFEWDIDKYPGLGFNQAPQIGLIAQEVEEVFPELVMENEEGYKAVAYDKLSAVLIEGMKEQQNQINDLKAEIEQLKKMYFELLNQIKEKDNSKN